MLPFVDRNDKALMALPRCPLGVFGLVYIEQINEKRSEREDCICSSV
jgi:hypothetical protein